MSFRALYRAHTPALLMLAQRLLRGHHADAEDAVQEAWVRAVRLLPAFRGESSARTWLCGIVINCCREMLRRRKPLSDLSAAGDVPAPPTPSASTHDLESLLRALPDGYREVLVLHDVEGYTHEEIAASLDISDGTSKSQLSRARATLRRWLIPEEKHERQTRR